MQETQEALVAMVKLGKFIRAQAADGLDVKDIGALGMKLATDEAFRAAFIAAFEGAGKIPAEVKAVTFEDGLALAMALIAELKSA